VFVSIGSLDGEIARTLDRARRRPTGASNDSSLERVGRAVRYVGGAHHSVPERQGHGSSSRSREAKPGRAWRIHAACGFPWEVKDLFKDWLERHYPLKAKHVMARIHDMRGGRDNDRDSAAA